MADMSTNGDIGPTSPCGDFDGGATENYIATDCLLARARCCRDWPVLAWTRMGRCGYCGEIPVVIGPWL